MVTDNLARDTSRKIKKNLKEQTPELATTAVPSGGSRGRTAHPPVRKRGYALIKEGVWAV